MPKLGFNKTSRKKVILIFFSLSGRHFIFLKNRGHGVQDVYWPYPNIFQALVCQNFEGDSGYNDLVVCKNQLEIVIIKRVHIHQLRIALTYLILCQLFHTAMGSFLGHVLPGTFFLIFGIWWAVKHSYR